MHVPRWTLLAATIIIFLFPRTYAAEVARPIVPHDSTVMELFVRADSEQSQRALQYLTAMKSERVGLEIKSYDVIADPTALARLWSLARHQGNNKPGVPALYFGDRLMLGYQDDATTGKQWEDLLTIRVFFRPGCRHCQNAREFLDGFVLRRPAIQVVYRDVIGDPTARQEVAALSQRYKVSVPSFPCIEVCGRVIIGFQGASITGRQIEDIFRDRSLRSTVESSVLLSSPQPVLVADAAYLDRISNQPAGGRTPSALPAFLVVTLPLGAGKSDNNVNQKLGSDVPVRDTSAGDQPMPVRYEAAQPDAVPMPDEIPLPEPLIHDKQASQADRSDAIHGTSPSTAASASIPSNEPVDQVVDLPWLGRVHVGDMGLFALTLAIGLIDGFNPCAMWVLVFLMSVLVNVHDRKKMIVIAGTFVVVSGIAYLAFMAAWFSVFQLIGLLRPVQVTLGVTAIVIGVVHIKDFFAFHRGLTLSIPESAKPAIYRRVREIVSAKSLAIALVGAITLAIAVNLVELLCTSGLPALYTEILTMQHYPWWMNYLFLLLYIAAYMFDDTVLVTAVIATLSRRRLQEREGRWLKFLSGVVILILGCVMVVRPEWLV